jgi:F-type H+-transporting ATPase subunit a
VRFLRRTLLLALPALLVLPAMAQAATDSGEDEFQPIEEFIVKPYFSISIGPIDLGVSKAVIYMWIAAAITIAIAIWLRGGLKQQPGRLQTVVELIYTFSETNIGRATLPAMAFTRWFPYVGALFVFIWTLNMISFIPLPFDTHNTWGPGIPGFTIYAATSSLSVTLALTLMTIVISHVEGIRANGAGPYFKSWVPYTGIHGFGGVLLTCFLIPLEVLSQLLRVVSLSVRLFANMLAGHLLIIMCLGFAILLGNVFISAIGVPVAVVFYLFEWGLVASLQAYIFAMLSGIYIGGAIEPAH